MRLLRARLGAKKGEWLFPADRGEGHFIGVRKVLGRVAARAGVTCTPHVLRHTFSSVAGDLGYSELTIAGLLGHSSKSVTSGYVHLDIVLVAAADRVSSSLQQRSMGNSVRTCCTCMIGGVEAGSLDWYGDRSVQTESEMT